MTSAFVAAFAAVIGNEGGYTADPADPGNWTGGAVGAGVLRGTKWGISAAAYPTLDIASLTLAQAQDVLRVQYWTPLCADRMPPALGLILFDSGVNLGVAGAGKLLQEAVGVTQDGWIGPETLRALGAALKRDADQPSWELLARRFLYCARLPTWAAFGLGWARRICRLPWQAIKAAPS